MALKIDAVAVASSDLKKILSFYTLLGFDPDAVNPYWVRMVKWKFRSHTNRWRF
jgi:hypothetical protein